MSTPLDLEQELQQACTECGYGILSWTAQTGTKDRAVTEIELMQEDESTPSRTITVILTTQGYAVRCLALP